MNLREIRAVERRALLATLNELGPAAPTLCADWCAEDVAAHLVVSEAYGGWPMVAAYGVRRVLPAAVTIRAVRSLQAVGERQLRRARRRGWDRLCERLASGPPRAYDRKGVAPIRLVEEWVHHEDLRRANAMDRRECSVELTEALWTAGRLLTSFPEFLPGREGIEVVLPDGRRQSLGAPLRVRVEGEVGEILLFLAGRTSAARVELRGDERHVADLQLTV